MYKGTMYVVITLVLLSAIPALPTSGYDKREAGHYLNMFLVQVDDQETAERVASDNGFQFIEKVRSLNYLVHCCFSTNYTSIMCKNEVNRNYGLP